jgi:hypothetical protein
MARENLPTLNHQRAEEESRGIIKYLRPDFQNPPAAIHPKGVGQKVSD